MRRAGELGRAEDERWHQRKDGSRFFCSGVMTPLESAAGGGFAKIARDMTGTKQQELAQEHRLFKEKKASLSAQMANELKDKFLAVMSHELKQPLNLIQMNAELLMHQPVAAENATVRRVGETIKRAVASQTRIINDLLDLSRIRTGKLRLTRVAVDLGDAGAVGGRGGRGRRAAQEAGTGNRLPARRDLPRRPRARGADRLEPAEQCGEVHARRRAHRGARACRGRLCQAHRDADTGLRHCAGILAACVRHVQPGRR
jgi:hypothetical protein